MCGIIFSTIEPTEAFDLIKYRGPDNTTIEHIDINSVTGYFGHHRLNIIEVDNDSSVGNQPIKRIVNDSVNDSVNNSVNDSVNDSEIIPFRNGREAIILVCNGEIYNYKELSEKYSMSPQSDCEVIIDCYLEDPENFVSMSKLDGDFAFILYDPIRSRIICGRDPVGLKPLYYAVNNRDIIACSELKVIEKLMDYPVNHCPINSLMIMNLNGPDPVSVEFKVLSDIFSAVSIVDNSDSFDDSSDYQVIKQDINNLLTTAVRKRLDHTNKPVAVLCSGGIDSSIIATLATMIKGPGGLYGPDDLEVFTMKYNSGCSMDSMYATMLIKQLGIRSQEVTFDWNPDKAADTIEEIIRILETYDPNTIRASIPMYLLAKYISENTKYKVILSGEGADELFMGYNYFSICSPTDSEAQEESKRLVKNLHSFDILRAERCFSAHGLELRVPFLDRDLIKYVLGVPAKYKRTLVEKQLLRDSVSDIFNKFGIPDQILMRQKERFSDGVGFSWVQDLINSVTSIEIGPMNSLTTDRRLEIEKNYYKKVYQKLYKNELIIPRELPLWAEKQNGKSGNLLGPCGSSKGSFEEPVIDFESLIKQREDFIVPVLVPETPIVFPVPIRITHQEPLQNLVPDLINIEDIINNLLSVMPEDMLDKTKCSVTTKNVYNYITKNYSSNNSVVEISWNDTLHTNFLTIDDMKDLYNQYALENSIAYVYYDHLCGHTSHYFIMLFNYRQDFYLLQSAVFEYSLACWTGNISEYDRKLLDRQGLGGFDSFSFDDSFDDSSRLETLLKIKNNVPATQCRNVIDFLKDIAKLEGPTTELLQDVSGYCSLFEKLFACNMPVEKYKGLFDQESQTANKIGQFRFRVKSLGTKIV
jgi:asparagine synthase (glutamine-hydrolysing)